MAILPDNSILSIVKLDPCLFELLLANSHRMLDFLPELLARTASADEKMALLESMPIVTQFFKTRPRIRSLLESSSIEAKTAFHQMIAIGQAQRMFEGLDESQVKEQSFFELLQRLISIDHFYREMGGIAGYQAMVLKLLQESKKELVKDVHDAGYHSPAFIDITQESPLVQEAVSWGIEAMEEIAEIYPLGGAADRLHLIEPATGSELPAAKLPFAGKTLLEHLIRDLQAREYLYYQKYGVQIVTPIAIMTSEEKNNHAHVLEICRENSYFGRPEESFRFFIQPLVPAVDPEGNWCLTGPLKPLFKPGGHGAIWKLARDRGIFEWLQKMGKKKALVRQINNPIAGLDYGLLAFLGVGCKKQMIFGFASCPRLLQAAEGVNVLIEKGDSLVLTNIEYCDFPKFGIEDAPLKEGEPYSRFSSNTNILFADLEAIHEAVDRYPFPGLLINLKKASYALESGEKKEEEIARLESTMQNIADVFVEKKGSELKTEKTFVTYNRRHKTISTAKKAYLPGKPVQETPENCFYDLLKAHRELLCECGFTLPLQRDVAKYLEKGPEFLFLYHPSLGPLYSLIKQKLSACTLFSGSELFLQISDLAMKRVEVQGSLRIIAQQPVGHFENGLLHFSDRIGSCVLENVTFENQGVDWSCSQPYWKMDLQRRECVTILLKGKSRLIAKNRTFKGSHIFIVEDGQTLEI